MTLGTATTAHIQNSNAYSAHSEAENTNVWLITHQCASHHMFSWFKLTATWSNVNKNYFLYSCLHADCITPHLHWMITMFSISLSDMHKLFRSFHLTTHAYTSYNELLSLKWLRDFLDTVVLLFRGDWGQRLGCLNASYFEWANKFL